MDANQLVPRARDVRLWIKRLTREMSVAKKLLELAEKQEQTDAEVKKYPSATPAAFTTQDVSNAASR